ncbi:MAG: hypothetical protein ACJ0GC_00335 [Amylibacter sp.]
MGSIIAAKIASLDPDKVPNLFMIEPVLYGPLESLKFRFMSFIKYNRGLSIADGAARRRREFPSIEDAVSSYTGRGAFHYMDSRVDKKLSHGRFSKDLFGYRTILYT